MLCLCLSCCGGRDGGLASDGFVPKKARDLKIGHPKIPFAALKPGSSGELAKFGDIRPEFVSFSCVACHVNATVDMRLPKTRNSDASKGPAYYLGGEAGTTFTSNSKAFEQPAPAVVEAGLESDFKQGEAIFEGNFVSDKGVPFGGLGPTYMKTSCIACHPGYGRARRTDNFDLEYGNGYIATVHRPDGSVVEGYTEMLQTKSVKPYLPYAKGVKITWHKFIDKYGNRYPDGSLYNSGRVGEGELVYPSAEIIEPLLPLPKDYKVSIESTIGIYGTGLLDAIPDEAILAEYRRQHALAGPVKGIHGNWIYDHKSKRKRLGKFTWHCSRATLDDGPGSNGIYNTTNVARADRSELYGTRQWLEKHESLGIDVSEFKRAQAPEFSMEDFEKFMVWHRGLAVPAARNLDRSEVLAGRETFYKIGCASCHKPEWTTGEYAPFKPYSGQIIRPYTDLLMHDMGEENRGRFRTYRTPPLWGRGLMRKTAGHSDMFHDLRARNFEEAILWHFGEAEFARELFRNLTQRERGELIDFLKSL